jgi:hypothetical protein
MRRLFYPSAAVLTLLTILLCIPFVREQIVYASCGTCACYVTERAGSPVLDSDCDGMIHKKVLWKLHYSDTATDKDTWNAFGTCGSTGVYCWPLFHGYTFEDDSNGTSGI